MTLAKPHHLPAPSHWAVGFQHMNFAGFPGGSVVKNLPTNAGDSSLIPGSRGSSGEGNGNSLQYSCLGNPMGRRPWQLQSMGSQRVRHNLVTKQQQRMNLGGAGTHSVPERKGGRKHWRNFTDYQS